MMELRRIRIVCLLLAGFTMAHAPWAASEQHGQKADAGAAALPRGVIVMWAGSLADIPPGWVLCDGSNGTPDLRDRFVMGVGSRAYLGSTGGAFNHRHRVDSHQHSVDPPRLRMRSEHGEYGYSGPLRYRYTLRVPSHDVDIQAFQSGPAAPDTDVAAHLPPYYKLAFIMKRQ